MRLFHLDSSEPVLQNRKKYLKAIDEIEELTNNNDDLQIADIPLAIQTIYHSVLRNVRLDSCLDTITSEFFGVRNGKVVYEVWHSAGPFSTPNGLRRVYKNSTVHGYSGVLEPEWEDMGEGIFLGQKIPRLNIKEIKEGKFMQAGLPHCIYADIESNEIVFNLEDFMDSHNFQRDDRVLMLCGSLKNREHLTRMSTAYTKFDKLYYNAPCPIKFEEGNHVEWKYAQFKPISINSDAPAYGRMVYLHRGLCGFDSFLHKRSRFLAASPYMLKN